MSAELINNQYDHDIKLDKEQLSLIENKNPGFLFKYINKSVNLRIRKYLEKIMLSDDIADIITVLNINPTNVIIDAISPSKDNAYPRIGDAFNKIFVNMRPVIHENEYDDDLHLLAYKKLRSFMKVFFNIMEKQLHLIRRAEKNIVYRFFDKIGDKLRNDKFFLLWMSLLVISIIIIVVFEISHNYISLQQKDYIKKHYEENIYSTALISSLWVFYNFIFD